MTNVAVQPRDEDLRFLSEIYELSAAGKIDLAGRLLFRYLNQLLSSNQNNECDRILAHADTALLAPELVIGFLSITFPARQWLRERMTFASRGKARLLETVGPERTKELLRQLLR